MNSILISHINSTSLDDPLQSIIAAILQSGEIMSPLLRILLFLLTTCSFCALYCTVVTHSSVYVHRMTNQLLYDGYTMHHVIWINHLFSVVVHTLLLSTLLLAHCLYQLYHPKCSIMSLLPAIPFLYLIGKLIVKSEQFKKVVPEGTWYYLKDYVGIGNTNIEKDHEINRLDREVRKLNKQLEAMRKTNINSKDVNSHPCCTTTTHTATIDTRH